MLKLVFALSLVVSVRSLNGASHFGRFTIFINGLRQNIEKAPYRVSLIYENQQFHCNGALIGTDWALTTAKCLPIFSSDGTVDNNKLSKYQVKIGAPLLSDRGKTIHVKNAYLFHDIVLLRLMEDVELSETANSIEISNRKGRENDTVYISGWDQAFASIYYYTDYFAAIEGTLISASEKVCSNFISLSYNKSGICVRNGDTFCNAEVGSPVVMNGQLIGLVNSLGSCNDRFNNPLYIVGTFEYLDWIRNIRRKFEVELKLVTPSAKMLGAGSNGKK